MFQAKRFDITINYKQQKLLFIKVTVLALILAFTTIVISPIVHFIMGIQYYGLIAAWITYGFIGIYKVLYFTQLILACMIVQKRFEALNESLENSRITNRLTITKAKNLNISEFAVVYHGLCDAIEIINNSFTYHTTFLFAGILVKMLTM